MERPEGLIPDLTPQAWQALGELYERRLCAVISPVMVELQSNDLAVPRPDALMEITPKGIDAWRMRLRMCSAPE